MAAQEPEITKSFFAAFFAKQEVLACLFLARSRRGTVTLFFALSLLPIAICICAGIDMSRLTTGRAALQAAADDAALSGAAAYSEGAAVYQALGLTMATSAFCTAAAALPLGFSLVASGTGGGTTPETCNGSAAGPAVAALTASYTAGSVGYAANAACTTELQSNASYTCGFIVTVTASATLQTLVPALFGASRTITVTAAAANPFINFAKVFTGTTITTGSKYANSVWVYPLLLNAQGQPDYGANAGALPDNSTCLSGGPDAATCGAGTPESGSVSAGYMPAATTAVHYVMLANTEYASPQMGSGNFTSPVSGITYAAGVVQNPPTPAGITATTPMGVAFQTIAGGNLFYNSATALSNPGVYGYDQTYLGSGQYVTAQHDGCAFPYDNLAYGTIGQVWQTSTNGSGQSVVSALLPWDNVSHWYFSSYLANAAPLPPSYQTIAGQQTGNETVLSVPQDPAQTGGNILGTPTYRATPYQQSPPAAAGTPVTASAAQCTSNSSAGGNVYSNSISQTSRFPTSGADNCSVFIAQSSTAGTPTPAPAQYDGACFVPGGTPGLPYAALSCQAYGSDYYFFYWNDMGGAQYDNMNYEPDTSSYTTSSGVAEGPQAHGDAMVVLHCASSTHVVLIQ